MLPPEARDAELRDAELREAELLCADLGGGRAPRRGCPRSIARAGTLPDGTLLDGTVPDNVPPPTSIGPLRLPPSTVEHLLLTHDCAALWNSEDAEPRGATTAVRVLAMAPATLAPVCLALWRRSVEQRARRAFAAAVVCVLRPVRLVARGPGALAASGCFPAAAQPPTAGLLGDAVRETGRDRVCKESTCGAERTAEGICDDTAGGAAVCEGPACAEVLSRVVPSGWMAAA